MSRVAVAVALAALLAACEERTPAVAPVDPAHIEEPLAAVRVSGLVAGEGQAPPPDRPSPYAGDASALLEGRQLFDAFNCAGCHGSAGGGGIGPPFADADWIYGGAAENIYASIIQGRPNGMPSFAGRMTGDAVWKVAAYVRSLGEQESGSAAEGAATPSQQQGRTESGGGTGAAGD